MSARAANLAWLASCLPGYRAFRRAMRDVERAQSELLLGILRRNADTEYGRRYELGRIAALPPKPDELEATVQYLTGTLALGTATQSGLAETLVDLMSDGKGVDWLQEYPARLAATTAPTGEQCRP